MRSLGIPAVLAILATPAALAQSALPDPTRTPGALNPEVTQATIGATICVKGWTRTVRPPQQYTSALKRQQIREFGYADRHLGAYEEDHLVPLGLGRRALRSPQLMAGAASHSGRLERRREGRAGGGQRRAVGWPIIVSWWEDRWLRPWNDVRETKGALGRLMDQIPPARWRAIIPAATGES